jgi:hypothetical protein
MTDQQAPPAGGAAPPAGGAAPPAGAEPAPGPARLARLEDRVEQLANAVAAIIPGSHADAQQRTEDRLDRPSSVQAEVRAELERARQEEAAAAAAQQQQTEAQELRDQVARLAEAPPRAPVPRRTRILGWGDPNADR